MLAAEMDQLVQENEEMGRVIRRIAESIAGDPAQVALMPPRVREYLAAHGLSRDSAAERHDQDK